jgi:hypothetical protein
VAALVSTYTGLVAPNVRPGTNGSVQNCRIRPRARSYRPVSSTGSRPKQVAAQVCGRRRLSADATPQVDDERFGGRDQAHRGRDRAAADRGREQDRLDVQVTHGSGEPLHAGHAAPGLLGPAGHRRPVLLLIAVRHPVERIRVVEQPQVLVTVHRLQVRGHRPGQRLRLPAITPVGQGGRHHLRDHWRGGRVDVLLADQGDDFLDHSGHVVGIHDIKETIRVDKASRTFDA